MTSGWKGKGFLTRLCIWVVIWALLSAAIAAGLVYLDIADIPVVEDALRKIEMLLHKEHEWTEATCLEPRLCEICGETQGSPLGHVWSPATCTEPERCGICGETGKAAAGHDWIAPTCTEPKTCRICSMTEGSAAGHMWSEATYDLPKTCQACGETDGEPLKPDPIYLVDMDFCDKYGKLWTWSEYPVDYYAHGPSNDSSVYMDMNTPGHITGQVYDHEGNRYTNALWVDLGGPASPYYVSYNLEGNYTTLTFTCGMMEGLENTAYTKYFDIYFDGKLEFTSKTMGKGESSVVYTLDVSGVQVIRIQYPPTKGENSIAAIFDAKLS